jgi:predicted house-cleaning noncanonical NTP pyrophosphatase (MazG superfamily)
MKEKFLPWFLLFCALGLSGTAAYYSVIGLSVVFVGVAIPVIVMGTFLEISKIAIATYLHDKWKETYGVLKIYMTIALITLSIITSLGIYGLLSTGFQGNIAKLEIGEKQVKNVEVKKKRFEEIKTELTKEKTTLDGDITKLRDGLSNNTTTQTVDKKTGQLITMANNANRKSFEGQLKEAQTRRDTISKKIDAFNDSITKLDVQILDMQSQEISGSELGAIKYISDITGWGVKQTANIFILILIFVFDPLAITLVIATNQAFKGKRKEDESPEVIKKEVKTHLQKEADRVWETVRKLKEEGVFTEQTEEEKLDEPTSLAFTPYYEEEDTTQVTDQVPTNYRPSTDEVEEYFEDKNYEDLIQKIEVEPEIKQTINQPKRLTYANRNGGSFRISRI